MRMKAMLAACRKKLRGTLIPVEKMEANKNWRLFTNNDEQGSML
jgi:hypothetical protein